MGWLLLSVAETFVRAPEELDWLHCIVSGLNLLYTRSWVHAPHGPPSATQRKALDNLLYDVRVFREQCAGLIPDIDWDADLCSAATSYDGEELFPAEPLDRDRLLEALPPREACAAVRAVDVTEGWIRAALSDPGVILKDESELGSLPPAPKVWASNEEWELIAGDLLERGILKTIEYEDIVEVQGRKMMGGMFGVKKGSHLKGEGPQRLVMNITPSNFIQNTIEGDMPMLPHSDKWKSVILRSGEVMLWSAEDLKCCFYVYSLGDVWLKYMAISKPVRRCVAGLSGKGMIYLAAAVVPMGWISATGVIQHIHRRLLRARHPELRQLSASEELRKDAPIPPARRGGSHISGVAPVRGEVGRTYDDDKRTIYIGRGSSPLQLAPSKWGNPFRIRDGLDRRRAIELFAEHLEKSPDLLADLSSLSGVRLLCHCKEHQACHGDVLIAKWLERFNTPALWRAWQVYVDNLDVLEITDWWHAKSLQEEGISEAVDLARRRYEHFNVPRSENKAVICETTTQSLGEAIDGERGTIGPPAEFVRRLISLTLATLQRPTVTQKWMQILAGRWVRYLLFRREAMMCFTHLWRFLVKLRGDAKVPRKVREELASALTLLPLLRCDLRVPISGLVTVSDASMQRGAVCRAVRIRPDGVAAARAASRRLVTDFRDEVVLLSLFDGIGGARRALDLLGLAPALFVSAEIDAEAKRVTKYAWPDVLEAVAIRERVQHVKWILVVAGSPCSDLSRINAERTGPQGRRSRLFYEVSRIVSLLREALGDFCTVLSLVENVASMDSEPRQLMSQSLECEPVCISAGDVTHCQRDRLYWIKEELLTPWQGESSVMDSAKHVVIPDGPGPVERWLAAGLQWQGDVQEDFRLPTFLRCVPRRAPGQFPSGLDKCASHEVERWRRFNYCYAPYQFQDINCIEEPDGSRRPPSSVERELLLDFLPGHTITARVTRARKLEKADLECCRCALLGNSFQCVVVAWVLAHWAQRAGYLAEIPSVGQMRETGGDATIADATVSMDQMDCDDGVLVRQHDLESEDAALDPSIIIVEELARRAVARGSDIRLDTFEAMRPDLWPRRPVSVARWSWKATAIWDWKHPSRITDLE
ncbi:unnamed protein product, partial [Prorocentrum cordatum]